jgi:hypothetical protein
MDHSEKQHTHPAHIDEENEARKPFTPPELKREDTLTKATGEQGYNFSVAS